MNTFNHLLVVLGTEIGNNRAYNCFKGSSVLEARLHVDLVVVASETGHETSKEVSNFNGVE